MKRLATPAIALWLITSLDAGAVAPALHHYSAARMSMACEYAIDAYGRDAEALPRILDDAFDGDRKSVV